MSLTPQQQRTAAARETFDARFSTPEEKSAYFRELGQREGDRRSGGLVLSADEAAALASAYDLLSDIAARARRKKPDGSP